MMENRRSEFNKKNTGKTGGGNNNQIRSGYNYNTRQVNQQPSSGHRFPVEINKREGSKFAGWFGKKEHTVKLTRYREGVDRLFLILVIILLCLGTVMIFSASYANALERYGDSYFFVKKQIIMALIGIAAMIITSFIDYLIIERFALPFFFAVLLLNYVTPFIGRLSHGATRWIQIGSFQLQPSEFLKLAIVVLFAFYISKIGDKMKTAKWGIGIPLLIMFSTWGALFMQSHLSGLIIMTLLCFVMMLIGEAPAAIFGVGGAVGGLIIFLAVNFNSKVVEFLNNIGMEHAGKRIAVWLDPTIDPLGDGHQVIQSLYAIGSGGLTGLGWGQSRQKFLYLPEPQNDFIFAILCEEMGFIGAILIIALFILLIWKGFVIAYHAPSKFSSLLVMGITVKVALQFILNLAVVTNILPATGIPLPFFSYGGTALIVLMAEMGIVLSVSRYSYQEKP